MEESFFQKVYNVVKKIPRGKVATYRQISHILGNARLSMQISWALHANPAPVTIPCHRVVNKYGDLADDSIFGGKEKQKELLLSEGVVFRKEYTVSLSKCMCKDEDLI